MKDSDAEAHTHGRCEDGSAWLELMRMRFYMANGHLEDTGDDNEIMICILGVQIWRASHRYPFEQ